MRNPYLTLYDKYDASKKIPLQVAFKTICFIDYIMPPWEPEKRLFKQRPNVSIWLTKCISSGALRGDPRRP